MSGDPMFTLNSTERHGVCVWNGKADGASGQGVSFAITGNHDNRPTDMTNIIVMENEEGLRPQQTALLQMSGRDMHDARCAHGERRGQRADSFGKR